MILAESGAVATMAAANAQNAKKQKLLNLSAFRTRENGLRMDLMGWKKCI